MDSIEYIQIFGERNSGTNYLQSLIANNVKGIEIGSNHGWKHGYVHHKALKKKDLSQVLFLVLFKDPYSWIVSMHKKPHHAPQLYNLEFSDFIRREWACYKGTNYDKRDLINNPILEEEEMLWERNPETLKRFENVIELRNFKTNSFLQIPSYASNFMHLTYESLLQSPEAVIRAISERFDMRMNEDFKHANGYYGKDPKLIFNKKDFYTEKAYLNAYSQFDLDYVNRFLDEKLEQSIGYELIMNL